MHDKTLPNQHKTEKGKKKKNKTQIIKHVGDADCTSIL